ncbi:MAG TPA: hypothetical protein VFO55_09890 [Gemmatimonadaceae bacterium]|nr:hypothetical protein [Gemmatimonadaceae bacterium]
MDRRWMLCIAALALGACSKSSGGNDRDTMTQRQKDSVFGQSAIPGAGAVTKAQTAADSLEAARKRADSAMKADTTF